MALFGKSKTINCAICGTEAKTGLFRGMFQKKVEGQYVCGNCYGVVDLPSGMVDKMTLSQFKEYMAFREENQKLCSGFQITHQADIGKTFYFDLKNRLLCMSKNLSTTIFTADNIQSFVIKEDDAILFQGDAAALICNNSKIPGIIRDMTPQIQFAQMQLQLYMTHLNSAPEEKKEEIRQKRPNIQLENPFHNYFLEIQFAHPYWNSVKYSIDAPTFDQNNPSVQNYMDSYNKQYAALEKLANCLTAMAFPGAKKTDNRISNPGKTSGNPKSSGNADPFAELKRYKELLDMGILTQEEFDAKKKQLLNL